MLLAYYKLEWIVGVHIVVHFHPFIYNNLLVKFIILFRAFMHILRFTLQLRWQHSNLNVSKKTENDEADHNEAVANDEGEVDTIIACSC
jgi:hypothetical protein